MPSSPDTPKAESDCVTERRDAGGYYWRYDHSADEPRDSLAAVIMIAAEIAAEKARQTGKTHFVASTPLPSPAIYVLTHGHPELSKKAISVMLEFRPDGKRIRHEKPTED
jgi:hypothetical protein